MPEELSSGPDIAIIILHWRDLDLTERCIASLRTNRHIRWRVMLVDNGSGDAVAARFRNWPEVEVLTLPQNIGFAAGNNAGIRQVMDWQPQSILLLNNDTELASDCLLRMYRRLFSDERIGAVVPKIYYYDAPGKLWYAGGAIYPWRLSVRHFGFRKEDRGQWNEPRRIEFATGCVLLIRREALQAVGLLEETFYSYFEDVDYSLRLLRADWEIWYEPAAKVWHKVGAGTEAGRYSPYYLYYQTRNRYWAFRTYRGNLFRIYARVAEFFLYFLLRLVVILFHRNTFFEKKKQLQAVMTGYRDSLLGRLGAKRELESE